PPQKLLQLSGDRLGSGTEKEEVQFTTVLCSKIQQDPNLLPFILQGKSIQNGRRAPEQPDSPREEGLEHPPGTSAPPAEPSPARRDSNLITCLVGLCRSKKRRVALKARQNVLLLAGLSQEAAVTCLARGSALCQLLTGHLCDLYSAVPPGTDPADVLAMDRGSWRSQGEGAEDGSFPGKESLAEFLGWLDFLDELVMGAHPKSLLIQPKPPWVQFGTVSSCPRSQCLPPSPQLVAEAISEAVDEKFFQGTLQPQLLQMVAMPEVSPCWLCQGGGSGRSITLLAMWQCQGCHPAVWVTGWQCQGCHPAHRAQISLASLRLFEELLKKPHEHVAHNLVLRNLEARAYLQRGPQAPPETDPE
ncbi:F16B2 protein, partial [Alaudala cheleensis]|nr:F16B2 protein [Alaudala cheleensis]